jgi:sulfur-oxidizing protein SoxY
VTLSAQLLKETFWMSITDNGFSATRRLVLKGTGTVAMIGLGTGLGVIAFDPKQAFAAANDKYPEEAFKQKSDADAIKLLYGKTAEPSDKVKMDAPEIAENGAVVPVSVSTTLADVTSIAFLVSENPNALIAMYKIPAGTIPSVANRIKMAKTSNVIVIVEAGGKLYSATKEVKVTVGGCGG